LSCHLINASWASKCGLLLCGLVTLDFGGGSMTL
jgi:hypothetical protein